MRIKGIAASDGIEIAKVFKLEETKFNIPTNEITNKEVEFKQLEEAFLKATEELEKIRVNALNSMGEEHAMIFEAHKQIVNDPEILAQVQATVTSTNNNVIKAYNDVCDQFASIFDSMDNDYMKERAADVRDVKRRVVAHLLGVKLNDPSSIDELVIVVAEDLTPSDTAQLNRNFVLGFATNIGGRTSHSAIMARSLEIPAVVGTKKILETVKENDILLLNGIEGYIIINPTEEEITTHNNKKKLYNEQKEIWAQFKEKESITKDNVQVELAANIGSPEDLDSVLNNGAEGVGLYRTEFLYMNNDQLPTEEEQFKAYKKVLETLGDKKVVIRTLDIGGDKHLDYLPLDEEMNPFLGHRALRLCLDRTDIFKTQLRALLKASKYGNLHIMFPMVALLSELREAKQLLKECETELKEEGIEISSYKVGIMVEIPSVAILADQFAKEVDFFSIGTNDLIQYSFAADRMNQKVSYLYQPLNPSLLRLIKMVIDASHKEGKWTGMCGEMAGDQNAVPILLGLGLDEFSMSATSVLQTRHLISKLNKEEMITLSDKALNSATADEVLQLINEIKL